MKRLALIFLLLCCRAADAAASGAPQCLFQYYSALDGLTHDRIADIYTDSRGFVWVCTWYGVSRFDGYAFKNFSTVPADYSPLTHHRFVSVSEDACGHLWFLTYNLHLYRLNRYTERFEDVAARIEGVDSKHYRALFCRHDSRGDTWVSISGLGVVRFSGAADDSPVQVGTLFDTETLGGEVAALFVDGDDNAWIAAEDGSVNRVAAVCPDTVRRVFRTREPVTVFDADDGHVYALSRSSFVRAGRDGASVEELPGARAELTCLAVDKANRRVYAGGRTGELYRVSGDRLAPLSPKGARPSRIRKLDVDSHGVVWVTTPATGITRYNPATHDYKHFEQEPYTVSYNIDTLTHIAEGGGRLWVKMNNYGFGYYDRENDRIEPFFNDPKRPDCQMTNAVVCFDVSDDVLWLSTYYERGLRRAVVLRQPAEGFPLPGPGGGSSELKGEVRALMKDRRGRM
ncbi:MAG: hypothetical protein K2N04_07020, partial [Alistipes sp.]|nr:hypothetical protein [Alistipes sp.]